MLLADACQPGQLSCLMQKSPKENIYVSSLRGLGVQSGNGAMQEVRHQATKLELRVVQNCGAICVIFCSIL